MSKVACPPHAATVTSVRGAAGLHVPFVAGPGGVCEPRQMDRARGQGVQAGDAGQRVLHDGGCAGGAGWLWQRSLRHPTQPSPLTHPRGASRCGATPATPSNRIPKPVPLGFPLPRSQRLRGRHNTGVTEAAASQQPPQPQPRLPAGRERCPGWALSRYVAEMLWLSHIRLLPKLQPRVPAHYCNQTLSWVLGGCPRKQKQNHISRRSVGQPSVAQHGPVSPSTAHWFL